MDIIVPMPFIISVSLFLCIGLSMAALFNLYYQRVATGTALIINDLSGKKRVSFTNTLVLPIIHSKETLKMPLIPMEFDWRGKNGLKCADNIRVDIRLTVYLKIEERTADVLSAVRSMGVDKASDAEAVRSALQGILSQAICDAGQTSTFFTILKDSSKFHQTLIEKIGHDLFGYTVVHIAIDYLEQTPLRDLDPEDVYDAENIRVINELIATQKT